MMAETTDEGTPPSAGLRDKRVTLDGWRLAQRVGDLVMVGKRFAFFRPGWIEEAVRGVDQLGFSQATIDEFKRGGAIVFLGEQEVTLPGAQIAGSSFICPDLISLTSDKALYRAGKDAVRLLIASPQRPNQELKLTLRLSGNHYASYAIALDEYGVCLRSIAGLPEGEYEASLDGTEAGSCRFEVAEYRLAPLTADLVGQTLEGSALSYTLLLRAFGQPYSGAVEVELQERGQRVGKRQQLMTDARGRCSGKVELTGAGPYTLNVVAGERTATVALKGSEQERRETLTISELGQAQEMSLLPLPGAEVCRGLYVSPRGMNTSPFLVSQVIGEEVELVAREQVDLLRAVMIAPTTGETAQIKTQANIASGARLTLTVPAPYGLLLVGAFVKGKAWEGWCAALRPSGLKLETRAPSKAKPGERVKIILRTNRPDQVVPVQVIIKDQRLITPSDPQVELAARIKAALTTERGRLGIGAPGASLYAAGYEPPLPPAPPMMTFAGMPPAAPAGRGGWGRMGGRAMAMVAAAPQAAPYEVMARAITISPEKSAAEPAQAAKAELTPIRVEFPEVIHNSIVYVKGQAEVAVKLGDALTTYSIEAFGLAGLDWAREEAQLEAQLPVYGDLTLSPFVSPGDQAQGTLYVGAASGRARVEVQRDGEPVPLWVDGRRLAPGEEVKSGAVVRFPAQPGAFTAIVKDAVTGEADVSERFVTPPGQIRSIVKRTRLLTAGETLTRAEAGAQSLRVLPGLERPFQVFVQGACAYPHGCIEQSSVKLLAMVAGYVANLDTPELRDEYESSSLAYVKRIQSMYLPGRGYTMYPPNEGGGRGPDHHYAPGGTRHQLNLPRPEHLSGISQAMAEALNEIRRMASDAAKVYKITYPPERVNDCHDAYLLLASSPSAAKKAQAAEYVRSRLSEQDGQTVVRVPRDQPSYLLHGAAVGSREETAYAAAALLAGGEPRDLPLVIKATNYLTSQTNEAGILYSTVDTGAMLALMIGLREAGIGVTGGSADALELNGKQMTLAEAIESTERVESVACLKGVLTVEVTAELVEDWNTFQSALNVEVSLEKDGRPAPVFKVGDALDLVIRVPRYEPCLVAHVCLPDGLARVVGGGQVKRFALDFAEKTELRVPLAAIGPTLLPGEMADGNGHAAPGSARAKDVPAQHWAVLVRNMFKEEQAGNPGPLEVRITP
ncbi:MAG TPA: hypothetical protein VH599_12425 [Ktedonobacterales bacterium]|jgi:hypothetical protein